MSGKKIIDGLENVIAGRFTVRPSPPPSQGDREARDNLIDLIGSACDAYSAKGRHTEKQEVVRRYADAILAALPNTEGLVADDPLVGEDKKAFRATQAALALCRETVETQKAHLSTLQASHDRLAGTLEKIAACIHWDTAK